MPQLDQMTFFSQVFFFSLLFYSLYFVVITFFLPLIFYILRLRGRRFSKISYRVGLLWHLIRRWSAFDTVIHVDLKFLIRDILKIRKRKLQKVYPKNKLFFASLRESNRVSQNAYYKFLTNINYRIRKTKKD